MRGFFVFCVLLFIKLFSRCLYRYHKEFVGHKPADWARNVRILAVLNHTSLYEPLLIGFAPVRLIWDLAWHGVLPVAEKTMNRPIGQFFRHLVRHVVVVTRQRDQTWDDVLNRVDSKACVMILPEGRMKRRNGLDSNGKQMTVRGGIADILGALDNGRMLMVYSGGLHHIQAPGERVPRIFRTIKVCMEVIDIPAYRRELDPDGDRKAFKPAVVRDLERRRDANCPPNPSETTKV